MDIGEQQYTQTLNNLRSKEDLLDKLNKVLGVNGKQISTAKEAEERVVKEISQAINESKDPDELQKHAERCNEQINKFSELEKKHQEDNKQFTKIIKDKTAQDSSFTASTDCAYVIINNKQKAEYYSKLVEEYKVILDTANKKLELLNGNSFVNYIKKSTQRKKPICEGCTIF